MDLAVGAARAGEDTVSFESMWADLQPVGRSAQSGGYRRFAWTREDHDLREWFAGECVARGLDLTEDRMGNQWAWWGDPDAAAAQAAHLSSELEHRLLALKGKSQPTDVVVLRP